MEETKLVDTYLQTLKKLYISKQSFREQEGMESLHKFNELL